jgi:excisionase family DNA binding protein
MPEPADGTALLSISQAAQLLGVHPQTLRAWADKGLVPHVRLPSGQRRFDRQRLERVRADMWREARNEPKPVEVAA